MTAGVKEIEAAKSGAEKVLNENHFDAR